MAENFVGGKIGEAVISMPPGLSVHQAQAIKDACEIAGIPNPFLMSDTTAVAIYYTFYSDSHLAPVFSLGEKKLLIVNVGAGTTGAAVAVAQGGVIKVQAAACNHQLGGDDIDRILVNYVVAELRAKHGIDITGRARNLARLSSACERAKRDLSSMQKTLLDLEGISEHIQTPNILITQDQFHTLCGSLYDAIVGLIKTALAEANVSKDGITDILLVGGATRTPGVARSIQDFFRGQGQKVTSVRNLDDAVAYGCAVRSAIRSAVSDDSLLPTQVQEKLVRLSVSDVFHHSLNIAVIPNPDTSQGTDYLPPDGGSPHESVIKTILKRNSQIPGFVIQEFSTASRDQTTVHIQIYEGESIIPSQNALLVIFELQGIPKPVFPARRATVEVRIDVAVDRSIVVHARHLRTGGTISRRLAIDSGRLRQEEKRAMIKRAKTLDGA
ncbi:hypothetical protein H1R20_g14449, partial [Candolleomyces eurysporus]